MWVHLDYVWVDGNESPNLRSKTKIVELSEREDGSPELALDSWNFDGSSTNQAITTDSERVLQPVRLYRLSENHFVCLCEVFLPKKDDDGSWVPHESNHRYILRTALKEAGVDMWLGFEQEYFFTENGKNIFWPDDSGEPPNNNSYYCSSGGTVKYRKLVRDHADMCQRLGIQVVGYNAEVAPGQWEYQCFGDEPLLACDNLWMSRYLLELMSEGEGLGIDWSPKPHEGWNGSGCHTNFSTMKMREEGGEAMFSKILENMQEAHIDTMNCYGAQNRRRLSGGYETAPYEEFSYGVGSRGSSIRVPTSVEEAGWKGYLEDRRPASNCDPYRVVGQLIKFV
tara:strand:- start:1014 stop:2030 length:1017 start_codon:yes stop_codon:yes gene_type:complete